MTACKFVSFMVPAGNSCSGWTKQVSKCEVHNWMMDGHVSTETLCPLGRIEAATEAALERIEEYGS